MLKALAAIVARALAAAGRVTLVPIIEGGKLVWRTVRSALVPPDPVGEAKAAFEAEAQRVVEAPAPVTFDMLEPAKQWGLAAAEHLQPSGDSEIPPGTLDRAALAYLDGLTPQERATLLSYEPRDVGEHLLGERALKGLPKPPKPAEFAAIEGQAAAASAAATRAEMEVDEAQIALINLVFDDILDEQLPRAA
ncbi:hypothetical protein ABZT49_06085 [Methylobacterium sp. EM32]|uniref:hypothetical protein n=1 Tax=Methylobacterium sp. EM32 TaxID=3163481 RepID=UPI0033A916F9